MKKQNLDPSLETSIKTLRGNPIFRLSLGSKELFHSNFWEYLLTDVDSPLPAVRAFFGIPKNADIKVLREKKNFDLLVYWEEKDKRTTCLIIENKVKSLPDAAQLKKYAEKTEAGLQKLLKPQEPNIKVGKIRLAVIAPKRLLQECDKEFWKEASGTSNRRWEKLFYEDLAEAIEKNLRNVKDCCEKWMLRSYKNFLVKLCGILATIKIGKQFPFFPSESTINDLRKIRIHDVYEKVWFAILKNRVKKELAASDLKPTPRELYQIAYTNAGARLDYAFTRDKTPSPAGKIFVLQLQRGKFCIGVNPVPEKEEKHFNKKIEKIFKDLNLGGSVKKKDGHMLHFGDFRYYYVKVDGESFAHVIEKATCALKMMKRRKGNILKKLKDIAHKKRKHSASKETSIFPPTSKTKKQFIRRKKQ